jgi:two-component system, OmpR family, phosphate regulon response regulator PhoB
MNRLKAERKGQKVLVVDDEPDITDLVSYHLKAAGYEVATVNDPIASVGTARSFQPDLIVLDIMMPDLNGIQICRILRTDPKLKGVPIIFLTAKGEEADRVAGFEAGGDDYLCKPFSIPELVLRVRSILHRTTTDVSKSAKTLQIGKIFVDIDCHAVTVNGQPVQLTATEFKLLCQLMESRGRVVTREHLLINVWNYETEIETRTIDTHVRRLREKLGSEAAWIETVRGIGYRMVERKA